MLKKLIKLIPLILVILAVVIVCNSVRQKGPVKTIWSLASTLSGSMGQQNLVFECENPPHKPKDIIMAGIIKGKWNDPETGEEHEVEIVITEDESGDVSTGLSVDSIPGKDIEVAFTHNEPDENNFRIGVQAANTTPIDYGVELSYDLINHRCNAGPFLSTNIPNLEWAAIGGRFGYDIYSNLDGGLSLGYRIGRNSGLHVAVGLGLEL